MVAAVHLRPIPKKILEKFEDFVDGEILKIRLDEGSQNNIVKSYFDSKRNNQKYLEELHQSCETKATQWAQRQKQAPAQLAPIARPVPASDLLQILESGLRTASLVLEKRGTYGVIRAARNQTPSKRRSNKGR